MIMVRGEKRLDNLEVVYKAINWLGNMTWLNHFDILNTEVKYHWESESKTCHYQSNLFFTIISFCLTSK